MGTEATPDRQLSDGLHDALNTVRVPPSSPGRPARKQVFPPTRWHTGSRPECGPPRVLTLGFKIFSICHIQTEQSQQEVFN